MRLPRRWKINYEFISLQRRDNRSFTFALASVTSTEGTSYTVFLIYEAQYDMTAVSENWEVLTLDGYGTATYIDAKGVVQSTYYTVSTDEDGNMIVGLFDFGTMDYVYYTVDPATGTFTA